MIIKRLAFERELVQHLDRLGIDHAPVTRGPGFDALDRQQRLYRLALFAHQATGDELLGLRAGASTPPNAYGPLGFAIIGARTPRQAAQTIMRHMRLFQAHPPNAAILANGRDDAIIEYAHPVRLKGFPAFVPDLFFSSTIATLQHLGTDLRGASLELDYSPRDREAHRREVGLPVTYRAARNRLRIPLAAMDAPLPASFSPQSGLHARLAENALAHLVAGENLEDRVRGLLSNAASTPWSAPEMAAALHVSERSLRRRLAATGVSFSDLTAQVQADLARSYLGTMPVRDVAELLGYHDASTFRRAFRRWTGETPSNFTRRTKF